MPPRLLAGTSGFSYKEWKGSFYPEDLAAGDMLAHYAERLPAVEINNTFYRMPKREVLETWAAAVPDGFRFSIKASRRITHMRRIQNCEEELDYLLGNLSALGDKLGVVLFQLPPFLKIDRERLERFLAMLPEGTPSALEFRHPSWHDDDVFAALRSAGTALVAADTGSDDDTSLLETASRAYVRLRRPGYTEAELSDWSRRLAALAVDEAFVFFKHEDEAAGPRMARDFLALADSS